jgi:hypothetical protein
LPGGRIFLKLFAVEADQAVPFPLPLLLAKRLFRVLEL